jgi:N-acetyltransferase 10
MCGGAQTVQYIQPQHHDRLGQAELLVIDEAAAIPLPTVRAMLGPYLVFLCSTVNGCGSCSTPRETHTERGERGRKGKGGGQWMLVCFAGICGEREGGRRAGGRRGRSGGEKTQIMSNN